jgi:ribosomal protein S3AE
LAAADGVTDGFLEFIGRVVTVNVKTVVGNETHDFQVVVVRVEDDDGVSFVSFGDYCTISCELLFD